MLALWLASTQTVQKCFKSSKSPVMFMISWSKVVQLKMNCNIEHQNLRIISLSCFFVQDCGHWHMNKSWPRHCTSPLAGVSPNVCGIFSWGALEWTWHLGATLPCMRPVRSASLSAPSCCCSTEPMPTQPMKTGRCPCTCALNSTPLSKCSFSAVITGNPVVNFAISNDCQIDTWNEGTPLLKSLE